MKNILLSFDLEEFDAPVDFGRTVTEDDQFSITRVGLDRLLPLLDRYGIAATFYTTARWALHYPEVLKTVSLKHEIASHSFYHSTFKEADLAESKNALESITGRKVHGIRLPRMKQVSPDAIRKAGYLYDSSFHPTFIPGRYNHYFEKRTVHRSEGLIEIPASVTPLLRVPLFWMSFHHMPLGLYRLFAGTTLRKDNYLNLYFHPWEFAEIKDSGLPFYIRKCSGVSLLNKLERFVSSFQQDGQVKFSTTTGYLQSCFNDHPFPGSQA